MSALNDQIRADHVGSLLRPPELLSARVQFAEGALSAAKLREIEDKAILEILKMQRESGIQVFSDGEYRRSGWYGGFCDTVEGFVPYERTMPAIWKGDSATISERPIPNEVAIAIATTNTPGAVAPAASAVL